MLFLVIIPSILLFVYAWRRWRRIRQGKLPPECGLSWPIIGAAHLWLRGSFWEKLLDIQLDCLHKGSVTLLQAGINPIYTYYVLCDPDEASTVSNSCLERSFLLTDYVKAVFGNGLATSSGKLTNLEINRHAEADLISNVGNQRTEIHFDQDDVNEKNSTDVLVHEQARLLVDELAPKSGNGIFDATRYLKYAVMKILYTIIFSESHHDEEFCKRVDLCTRATDNLGKALYVKHKNLFTHKDFIFNNCTKSKTIQDEAIGILNNVINEHIENKVVGVEEEENTQVIDAEKVGLLHYLLKLSAEGVYTEDDVLKEIVTIIFSGYFTTSYTLVNVLNMLGSHLMKQEKVYEEITSLSHNLEENFKVDDLSRLPYLDAVIMETLRLYPPITFISRLADKEVVLGKYKLESNNNCLLCVYAMNRHPKWGQDADEFKPERWLIDDIASRPFASFGMGDRNCIGKSLSLSIMKILLIAIMREYVVSKSADAGTMNMKHKLFLHSESGHHISLQKRCTPKKL